MILQNRQLMIKDESTAVASEHSQSEPAYALAD